jgi:hypothetical protein
LIILEYGRAGIVPKARGGSHLVINRGKLAQYLACQIILGIYNHFERMYEYLVKILEVCDGV